MTLISERLPGTLGDKFRRIQNLLIESRDQKVLFARDDYTEAISNLSELGWALVEYYETRVPRSENPDLYERFREAQEVGEKLRGLIDRPGLMSSSQVIDLMQLQLLMEIQERLQKLERRTRPIFMVENPNA